MISKRLIKPARAHNETFADYRHRRALANKTIKDHLRGTLRWVASKFIDMGLDGAGHPVVNPAELPEKMIFIKRRAKGTLIYPQPRKSQGRRNNREHRAVMFEQECSK
jgi:hypothetical protein